MVYLDSDCPFPARLGNLCPLSPGEPDRGVRLSYIEFRFLKNDLTKLLSIICNREGINIITMQNDVFSIDEYKAENIFKSNQIFNSNSKSHLSVKKRILLNKITFILHQITGIMRSNGCRMSLLLLYLLYTLRR
jgi:hypothetical protein